jgi:hypothetical protein
MTRAILLLLRGRVVAGARLHPLAPLLLGVWLVTIAQRIEVGSRRGSALRTTETT